MSIESEAVADNKTNDDDLFAFTCTSAFSAVADVTPASTNSFGACTDSSASGHYFPDKSKFINYWLIGGEIVAADECALKALQIGDVQIDLLNGGGKTKALFKEPIHTLMWNSPWYWLASLTEQNAQSYSKRAYVQSGILPERP